LQDLICLLLQLVLLLVFAAVVVSWFPPGGELLESARRFLVTATEWLLGPIRRVLPPVRIGAAALDLSPMVVLLGVIVLRGFVC
jgi:YggT family protein